MEDNYLDIIKGKLDSFIVVNKDSLESDEFDYIKQVETEETEYSISGFTF